MEYRDDREALRSRAESLQADLGDAERRLRETEAKLRAQTEKDERDEKEVAALRKELERLRPPAPKTATQTTQTKRVRAVLTGGIVAGAIAVGFVSVMWRAPKHSSAAQSAAAAPQAPVPARTGTALFGALVVETKGKGPPAGTGCLVHARLRGGAKGLGVAGLDVVCGDETLYQSSASMGIGMVSRSSSAREANLSSDSRAYLVSFSLTGQWSGKRPQIDLDSNAQRARVWSDVLDRSTSLYVDDLSFPRAGHALSPKPTAMRRSMVVHRPLELVKKAGPLPSALSGANDCEIAIHPSPVDAGSHNCRTLVRCAGRLVYGNGSTEGSKDCNDTESRIVTDDVPAANDGDPEADIGGNQVVLRDGLGDSHWEVTYRMQHAPCLADGHWAVLRYGSSPVSGQLEVTGAQAKLSWQSGVTQTLTIDTPCPGGRVTMRAEGAKGPYVLSLGPGFVTAGGHAPDGAVTGLIRIP